MTIKIIYLALYSTFLKKNDWVEADLPELTEEDEETVRYCQQQLGYFISYENLFSTWLK